MKKYLSSFRFPGPECEDNFALSMEIKSYDQSVYPYYVLPPVGLNEIYFKPLTILYGGNGCGKSTALNVIAETLKLKRFSAFNRSRFFERFTESCDFTLEKKIPVKSRIITSDDVFNTMLDIRAINEGIEDKRKELAESYYALRYEHFQLKSLEDIEHLHMVNQAKSKSCPKFIKAESGKSLRERSNGESALQYFRMMVSPDTLCLLDEPENSLSPANQKILADFLIESVRYCGNQLIISTHSPFLLAMEGAMIIDMDNYSRIVDSWTELSNPREYYEFFKEHKREFAGA